jgi:NAD+ synthetase
MTTLHVAVAQIRTRKADYSENLGRMGAVFAQVAGWEEPPNVVVFPETATSGYFLEGGVRDVAVTAGTLFDDLSRQHDLSGAAPFDVVVGFYERHRDQWFNAAMYASLGGPHAGIRHVHRKVFLPTYGVFDERRFVQAGHDVRAFDTAWGRAAVLICEDAWHSLTGTLAALDGAQLLFIPSASPARGLVPAKVIAGTGDDIVPTSLEKWERLGRTVADEHGMFVVMSQLIGFEGGKGFPGGSLVAGPRGEVVARGPLFDEALMSARCDLEDVIRARTGSPLLEDLRAELPHLLRMPPPAASSIEWSGATKDHARPPAPMAGRSYPVWGAREAEDPLGIDPALVERWLVAFMHDEVVARRGFSKGVVGLSGGVDSSLTAFLAAKALGPENVIGVRMPYETSSANSRAHAERVAHQLGIRLETVEITGAVNGYAAAALTRPDPTRLGNVMARVRMITLFDLSAAHGALPLGTGNKTERLLGYFTWHADDSPPVNPLGDLFKTEVWALARHVGVPEDIVSKPATADLIRGQTDEGDLGISYQRADLILYWLVSGLQREEVVARGFTVDEVALVAKRLNATHWKRRLPTVAMVSQTAIGEYYLRPVDY